MTKVSIGNVVVVGFVANFTRTLVFIPTLKINSFPCIFAVSYTHLINLIRVAILVIFVWIGGLKFWNYEAEGIVPFVANSPFMSFFYTKSAPEYKDYKLKEGEFNEAKHKWHVENNTYGFSRGLGILIMAIGILTFLGIFSSKVGLVGALLAIIMTLGTLSFLVTTPEVWVDVYKRQVRDVRRVRSLRVVPRNCYARSP